MPMMRNMGLIGRAGRAFCVVCRMPEAIPEFVAAWVAVVAVVAVVVLKKLTESANPRIMGLASALGTIIINSLFVLKKQAVLSAPLFHRRIWGFLPQVELF